MYSLEKLKAQLRMDMHRAVDEALNAAFAEYELPQTGANELMQFVEQVCELIPGKQISTAALYLAYKNWAVSQSYDIVTHQKFSKDLKALNLPHVRSGIQKRDGNYWAGIGLKGK